jgi:predicted DCC family thiol-disulfide oxidoreductase YuxK
MSFPIVFYDGDCGFCNRTVQLILDNERSEEIRFSALQSDFAKQFFRERGLPQPDLSTFYFWDGQQMLERSTGALRVARRLKFPFSWLAAFKIVPRALRDGVYNWIAARRQKLANSQCALPTPEQRKRFLV